MLAVSGADLAEQAKRRSAAVGAENGQTKRGHSIGNWVVPP